MFQNQLKDLILKGEIASDREVYIHCLREGMLPHHGKEAIRELRREGRLKWKAGFQPRVSLGGYKEPRQLEVSDGDF